MWAVLLFSFGGGNVAIGETIKIDVGDLREKMESLSKGLSKEEIQKALFRAVRHTGKNLRAIATKEIRKNYAVKQKKIHEVYGNLQIQTGSAMKCYLPLRRSRGAIGKGFNATYEAVDTIQGANALFTLRRKEDGTKKSNRKPSPRAKIKIGKVSALPIKGKRIHFYVEKGKYKGHVFVRKEGVKRYPITHGVGIAIPQMSYNDAKEGIQKDVREHLYNRLEHEATQLLKGVTK